MGISLFADAFEPPEPEWQGECPRCGTPLNWDDTVYMDDLNNTIIGCQYCVTRKEAGDVFKEEI